jgi:Holliday junction resolvasome RuvABC endonuclease subunit
MPIREVFATGINCAVYGEAGAGKSTTLYQYAQLMSQNTEAEITLFLPLTRLFADVTSTAISEDMVGKALDERIAKFLVSGKTFSVEDVKKFLHAKSRVTFIFDGVDEVIKSAPWVIRAIESIYKIYENSQIILSSRVSGSYIDSIKYLSLTLLPFTVSQVNEFVQGWFREQPELASSVSEHLKVTPGLSEIVTSPLLATILCVLAENNVPLPAGELNMYDERLKLLLGHYDIHKKTRRIDSHHTLLEPLARKLAFYLHQRNIRFASPQQLESIAVSLMDKFPGFDGAQLRFAVRELHDPCNILEPMTAEGEFGFGHLRYQEHLAANELCANRGIDLVPLLYSPWWKSVLVLFARKTGDINHIFDDVLERGIVVSKCTENLIAIIETRTPNEQRYLRSLVSDQVRQDVMSQELKDFHDYDHDDDRDW